MPIITCGGMRYQHKWDDIPWSEVPVEGQKNIENTIAKAHELGVRHIETARGYGSSEMQLGPVINAYDREDWIIQTKVGPDADTEKFAKNFETSMHHLNVGYFDLFSFHGINNDETLEQVLRPGGCMEIARKFQKEGRIKHIGFSTHGMTPSILKTIETGEFDYVNVHWYFVNQLNWPVIEAASKRDMGVFIISPNDKGGKLYAPTEKLLEGCNPLDPMVFNDLFCWSRPEVHTLSMGVSKPEDFELHIDAMNQLGDAEQLIAPIENRLCQQILRSTGIAWEQGWDIGFPDWEAIPNHIHTREIVRLWIFAKAFDMVDFAKSRYNLLGNASHWFPGKMVQDFDDQQMIELHRESPFADRIPEILRDSHRLLFAEKVKRQSES